MNPAEERLHLEAESIFARALVMHPDGADVPIDELCEAHRHVANRLRNLHGQLLDYEGFLQRNGLDRSLQDWRRTEEQLDLPTRSGTTSSTSTETLTRLAARPDITDRYRIDEPVGHGGMGKVVRVWDKDLRRPLALKVMRDMGSTTANERVLSRFLEEAFVTGQLDHPGIVPVHELGLDPEGQVCFTMKLVKGDTLQQVLDEFVAGSEGWTETRIVGILTRVCEAMSYAHSKQVVHRDLKPDNVMVGPFGEVYVMDWGLAKVLDRDARTPDIVSDDSFSLDAEEIPFSTEGQVVGTLAYMPPEQAHGRVSEVGVRADVYAIGAMLYHLLAKRRPYARPKELLDAPALLQRVRTESPQALHEIAPDASPELVAICEKAMARAAADRYSTISQLADELKAYQEGRVVLTHERGAWAEAKKWVRRNRLAAGSLGGTLAAVAAAFAVVFLVKNQANDEALAREVQRARRAEHQSAVSETRDALRLGDWMDALAWLDVAESMGLEDDHEVVFLRSDFELARGNGEGARMELLRLASELPSDESTNRDTLSRIDIRLAAAFGIAADRHESSSSDWRACEALEGGLPLEESALAQALLAESTPESSRWLRRFVEMRPFDRFAAVELIGFDLVLGNTEQTLLDVERFESVFPADRFVPLARIQLRVLDRDWIGAEAALKKVPGSPSDTQPIVDYFLSMYDVLVQGDRFLVSAMTGSFDSAFTSLTQLITGRIGIVEPIARLARLGSELDGSMGVESIGMPLGNSLLRPGSSPFRSVRRCAELVRTMSDHVAPEGLASESLLSMATRGIRTSREEFQAQGELFLQLYEIHPDETIHMLHIASRDEWGSPYYNETDGMFLNRVLRVWAPVLEGHSLLHGVRLGIRARLLDPLSIATTTKRTHPIADRGEVERELESLVYSTDPALPSARHALVDIAIRLERHDLVAALTEEEFGEKRPNRRLMLKRFDSLLAQGRLQECFLVVEKLSQRRGRKTWLRDLEQRLAVASQELHGRIEALNR